MTDREALQKALEVLEEINKLSIGENAICLPAEIDGALDALRERLAQPEQEPVFGVVLDEHGLGALVKNGSEEWHCKNRNARRLYTTPPQRTWVGLTDEEIKTLPQWFPSHESAAVMPLIRAFEAKLREKNT